MFTIVIFNQIRKFFRSSLPGWLAMLLVIFCQWLGFFQPLELMAYNYLFQLRGEINWNERVVVIAIDESSLRQLGYFPWHRKIYTQLLEIINQSQPNVVAFDIIFSDPSQNSQDDQLLAKAIEKHGKVILARAWDYEQEKWLPLDQFTQEALITAHILRENDPDGITRKVHPQVCGKGGKLMRKNGEDVISLSLPQLCQTDNLIADQIPENAGSEVFPALGIAALEAYSTFADIPQLPNLEHPLWLNWISKIEKMPRYSLVDVIQGRITKDKLQNKIILVGVTALGLDGTSTPFDSQTSVGSIIIHATLINNILNQNSLRFLTSGIWIIFLLLLGPVLSYCLTNWSNIHQLIIVLSVYFIWLIFSLLMLKLNYWLPVVAGLVLIIITMIMVILYDHFRLKLENKNLYLLAIYDGLTKIHNRRSFDEYLQQEWRRMAREKLPISLILLDVDFFKKYNDTYGHQEGDNCLQKVAQTLTKAVQRPSDLAARYGGEEFVIILPNTNLLGAEMVAANIRQQIKNLAIVHSASSVSDYVTISMGIAVIIPSYNLPPTTLVKAADEALYQSKQLGRDRFTTIHL